MHERHQKLFHQLCIKFWIFLPLLCFWMRWVSLFFSWIFDGKFERGVKWSAKFNQVKLVNLILISSLFVLKLYSNFLSFKLFSKVKELLILFDCSAMVRQFMFVFVCLMLVCCGPVKLRYQNNQWFTHFRQVSADVNFSDVTTWFFLYN